MKNLIVLRCGKNSRHPKWLEGGERNWDIILCPYEEMDAGGLPSVLIPGQKWSGLHEFLSRNDIWRQYDYICLPDDDIAADAQTWSDFFDYCHALEARLAAPALTPNSYYTYPLTMQNTAFVARATSFVEIMNPCIRRDVLEQFLPTMRLSRAGTGYGLDAIWPAMLNYQNIWIIDQTPVHHTRPVGGLTQGDVATLANYDLRFAVGLGIPFQNTALGAVTKDFQYLNAQEKAFRVQDIGGHSYLLETQAQQCLTGIVGKTQAVPQCNPVALALLRQAVAHLNRTERNLSRGKPALVSSLSQWSWSSDPVLEASGGNDGRINGRFGFHTALQLNPWWQVDLEALCAVEGITLYNHLGQKDRAANLNITVSTDGQAWNCVHARRGGQAFGGIDGDPLRIAFAEPLQARFIRVEAVGYTFLHLDQVEVHGTLSMPVAEAA